MTNEREFIEADDCIEVSINYTVPVVVKVRLYRDPSDDTIWSVHVLDESVELNEADRVSVWTDPTIEIKAGAELAKRAVEITEGDEPWPSWEFGF